MSSIDKQQQAHLQAILHPAQMGLLVIDLQNDFLSLDGKTAHWHQDLASMQAILPKVTTLIDIFRELQRPIIWTKDHEDPEFRTAAGLDRFLWFEQNDLKNVACLKGSPGADFWLQPNSEDHIIEKTRTSAYVGTNLKDTIAAENIKTLVVVGVKTQRCVARTVHDLYDNEPDLHVVVLEDCVASDDLQQHKTALTELKQFYPPVISSQTLIDSLELSAAANSQ